MSRGSVHSGLVARPTLRLTAVIAEVDLAHGTLPVFRLLGTWAAPESLTLQLGLSFTLGVYSVTLHLGCYDRWNEERYDLQVFQVAS